MRTTLACACNNHSFGRLDSDLSASCLSLIRQAGNQKQRIPLTESVRAELNKPQPNHTHHLHVYCTCPPNLTSRVVVVSHQPSRTRPTQPTFQARTIPGFAHKNRRTPERNFPGNKTFAFDAAHHPIIKTITWTIQDIKQKDVLMRVGFEPTPFRTSDCSVVRRRYTLS